MLWKRGKLAVMKCYGLVVRFMEWPENCDQIRQVQIMTLDSIVFESEMPLDRVIQLCGLTYTLRHTRFQLLFVACLVMKGIMYSVHLYNTIKALFNLS